MITGIDHVVIVVKDLDTAIENYRNLGFQVVPGGVHGGGASHNALVGFQDGSYFELYAFLRTENARNKVWLASLERGGGVTDLCLRSDRMGDDVRRIRDAGLPYPEEFPMTRDRPDGQQVAWRLSTPQKSDDRWLPFLIEDDTPRELRVPSGQEAIHPNGVTGIARVLFAASDPAQTEQDLSLIVEQPAGAELAVGAGRFVIQPRSSSGRAVDGPFRVQLAGAKSGSGREQTIENAQIWM